MHQLLTIGRGSVRLMASTTLHLTGLLVASPPLALMYQDEIQDLLLCDLKESPVEVSL